MEIVLTIRSTGDRSVREEKCEVGNALVMGRGAENGILLDGPDLSREHLVLSQEGDDIYLTDTSVNGTWLNGTRLRKSVKSLVRPEDSIEVPGYVLSFHLVEQAALPAEPALLAQAVAPESALSAAPPHRSPWAVLDPAFRFTNSFTFLEKLMFFLAVGGLALVFTYMTS
jgi:predicted component of type VI protein secretion system